MPNRVRRAKSRGECIGPAPRIVYWENYGAADTPAPCAGPGGRRMMGAMFERQPFDLASYVRDRATAPCFICAMLAGDPAFRHHIIAEDDETVLFLSKYPTLPGYALVCPKAHVEDLAEGLSPDAWLRLQARVHRLSRALKQVFDAERIYVLSLGSQQGNRHLHFHVVPLPRGVPYEQQQYHALMAENGVLAIPEAEMADMAARIGAAYAGPG